MNKEEKQREAFLKQAEGIARDWTEAVIDGEQTHPIYSNKMYLLHQTAKEVMNAEDDEAEKKSD